MSFITESRAREASRRRYGRDFAIELKESAGTSVNTEFDIFLSHSYMDAEMIAGVKAMLEGTGVSVYVDWIEDNQLDRKRVDAGTANLLRRRMRNSKSLIYAASETSPSSKWMPWELGYFDGFRPDHVVVFPLVRVPESQFVGQEYLGLYPYLEEIDFDQSGRTLGIDVPGTNNAIKLRRFASYGAAEARRKA